MRVLGIDPGDVDQRLWNRGGRRSQSFNVVSGGISPSAKQPFPKRLKKIYEELEKIIDKYRPNVIVVEDLFVSKK